MRSDISLSKAFLAAALFCGVSQSQTPPPPAATSRVFIYQTKIRGLRANPVFCDGLEVASLRQRWSYFVLQLPPGEHAFNGRHKENEIVLDLLPGEDYYLRLDQVMAYPGSEKLVRNSAEEGRAIAASGKLHMVDPEDVRDHARINLK